MREPDVIRPDDLVHHAARLHRLARVLLRDRDLAADAAQDALLAAVERPPQTPVQDLGQWLAAVLRRRALRLRHDDLQRRQHEAAVARPAAGDDEQRAAARVAVYRELCDAVLDLPEPYRTAVSLRWFDGLPPRAIGRRLGIGAAAAAQRCSRGLQLLRARLDRTAGSRQRWQAAFAACGLGAPAPVALLASVILMHKLTALFVGAAVAALVWWSVAGGAPPGEPQPLGGGAEPGPAVAEAAPPALATAPPALQRAVDGLLVRVVDANGAPLPAALVLCHGGGDLQQIESGADGTVQFPPRDGPGGLLVLHGDMLPQRRELQALRGEVTVALQPGSVLQGRLLVDGEPAVGVPLEAHGPPARLWPSPPATFATHLEGLGSHRFVTAADGSFVCRGLPADWQGRLALPRWLDLLDAAAAVSVLADPEKRQVLLAGPTTGLEIAAASLPTVRGRAVWADSREGIPGALLFVKARFADPQIEAPTLGERTGADGRFRLGIYPAAPQLRQQFRDRARRPAVVELRLSANAMGRTAAAKFAGADGGPLDLTQEFVVELPPAERRWFRAVDDAGAPIAGARASEPDDSLAPPTDADGFGTFAARAWQVHLGAPGRQIAVLAAGIGGVDREHAEEVVLAPGNEVLVHVRPPDGIAADALNLRLTGVPPRERDDRGLILRGPGGDVPALRRWLGSAVPELPGSRLAVPPSGDVRLLSMPPGTVLRLTAQDAAAFELGSVDLTVPQPGGRVEATLAIPGPLQAVTGRVLCEGAPVPLALVGWAGGSSVRTDASGTFALPPVQPREGLRLEVTRPGCARAARAIAAADLLAPLQVEIARSHAVTVRIVDATGAAVPEALLRIDGALANSHGAQMTAPGQWEIPDLPPGEVVFSTAIGGRVHELRHDPTNPLAELRLPALARVRFVEPADLDVPTGNLMVLGTQPEASGPVRLEFAARGGGPVPVAAGRWRFELARMQWDGKTNVDIPLERSVEVELSAGALVTVEFR